MIVGVIWHGGAHAAYSEYSMRYRPELDLVLKDISMTIVRRCPFDSPDQSSDDALTRNRKRRLVSLVGQALESRR